MTAPENLFELAREAADIEAIIPATIKLFPDGRELRGECPLCGASKGKKRGGAFAVMPKAQIWNCHACEEGGDFIDLERELRGGTLREAAARLAKVDLAQWDKDRREAADYVSAQGFASERKPARARPSRPVADVDRAAEWKAKMAAALWRDARPAAGTLVETYLRARGLFGPVLDRALGQLRFHPNAYHSGRSDSPVSAPAMIGLVMTPTGPAGGVHATYLDRSGRRKADLDPAKRMWGAQDRDGRPGCCWLTRPDTSGPLIVAEGIESALSAAILMGGEFRVAAALSLRSLQGGWATDKWNRYDPDTPRADLEKPAFTWPAPAGGWPGVVIAVDRDMGVIKVRVRKAAGGTWKRPLNAEERARICGSLAQQHWAAAGAHGVRVAAPRPGRDFNDELKARLEAGDLPEPGAPMGARA